MKKYSVLNYLQEEITEQCKSLPQVFEDVRQWEQFRDNNREAVKNLLPLIRNSSTAKHNVTGTCELSEELVLECIDVHMDGPLFIPVHLYKRKEVGTSPAVIICPGYATPKNTSFYVSFAMRLAAEGIIALVMEYGGAGESADRPDVHTNTDNISSAAHLLGMNEAGLRVSANIAAFDYLKTRKDIDRGRIGITGLCQGSITTAYTVAVEGGFWACAPLCGATTYEAEATEYASRQGGWSGISPFVFGILKHADFQHLFASFAPKPMLIQNNITDIHWPLSGFERVKDFVSSIYGLYGKDENIQFRLENAPHAYEGAHSDNILNFFIKLKGEKDDAKG
jgi:dienelactone hydrolase